MVQRCLTEALSEILIRLRESVAERRPGAPAERRELGRVDELSWRAVGSRGVVDEFALEADHLAEAAPILAMARSWLDIASSFRKLAASADQARSNLCLV